MPYRATERTKRHQAERRVAIVDATRRLVEDGGLAQVSVAAVAAAAGIATGTVYRYFPTKDALIGEVIEAVCRRELELVRGIAERTEQPAPQRLADAVACFGRRTLASGRTAYAVIAEPSVPAVERLRTSLRRDLAASFRAIVADGIERGEFADQPADVAGIAIVGAMSEVLVGPVGARPTKDRPTATVDALVALVLRAVDGPSGVIASPFAAIEDSDDD